METGRKNLLCEWMSDLAQERMNDDYQCIQCKRKFDPAKSGTLGKKPVSSAYYQLPQDDAAEPVRRAVKIITHMRIVIIFP